MVLTESKAPFPSSSSSRPALSCAVQLAKALSMLLDETHLHAEQLREITQKRLLYRADLGVTQTEQEEEEEEGKEEEEGRENYAPTFLSPMKMLSSLFSQSSQDLTLAASTVTGPPLDHHNYPPRAGVASSSPSPFPPLSSLSTRLSKVLAVAVLDLWVLESGYKHRHRHRHRHRHDDTPSSSSLPLRGGGEAKTPAETVAVTLHLLSPLLPAHSCVQDSGGGRGGGSQHPLWCPDTLAQLATSAGRHVIPLAQQQQQEHDHNHDHDHEGGEREEKTTGDTGHQLDLTLALGEPLVLLLEVMALLVDACHLELAVGVSSARCVLKQVVAASTSGVVEALAKHRAAASDMSGGGGGGDGGDRTGRESLVTAGRFLLLQEVLLDACFLQQVGITAEKATITAGVEPVGPFLGVISLSNSNIMMTVTHFLRSSSLNITDLLLFAPLSMPAVTLRSARLVSKLARYSSAAECDEDVWDDDVVMVSDDDTSSAESIRSCRRTKSDFTSGVMQIGLSAFSSAFHVALVSEQRLCRKTHHNNKKQNRRMHDDRNNCIDDFMVLGDLSGGSDSHLIVSCPSDLQRLQYSCSLLKVWGEVFTCLLTDLSVRPEGASSEEEESEEAVRVLDIQSALLKLFTSLGGHAVNASLRRNGHMVMEKTKAAERRRYLREVNEVAAFGLVFLLEPILQSMRRMDVLSASHDFISAEGAGGNSRNGIETFRDFWSIHALFELSEPDLWWQKLEDRFSVGLTVTALGHEGGEGTWDERGRGRGVVVSATALSELQAVTTVLPVLAVGVAAGTPPLVVSGGCRGDERSGGGGVREAEGSSFFVQQLSVSGLVKTLLSAGASGTSTSGGGGSGEKWHGVETGKWVDVYTGGALFKHVVEGWHLLPPGTDRVVSAASIRLSKQGPGKSQQDNHKAIASSLPALVDGTVLGIMLFITAVTQLESLRARYLPTSYTGILLYFRDPCLSSSALLVKLLMDISRSQLVPLFEQRLLRITPPLPHMQCLSLDHIPFQEPLHLPSTVVAITLTQCLHRSPVVRAAAYLFLHHTCSSQVWPSLLWDATVLSVLLQCLEALGVLDEYTSLETSSAAGGAGAGAGGGVFLHEEWFSVEITPSVPPSACHRVGCIPSMVFPHQDRLALLAVVKPFLLLAYEWLTVAMQQQPWLVTSILEEYQLSVHQRGEGGSSSGSGSGLAVSLVQEVTTASGPAFHLTGAGAGAGAVPGGLTDSCQSAVHEARFLAAQAIAADVRHAAAGAGAGSNSRSNSSSCSGCCSQPVQEVRFFGPPQVVQGAATAAAVSSVSRHASSFSSLSSLALKVKCCGELYGRRAGAGSDSADTFASLHRTFQEVEQTFRLLLNQASGSGSGNESKLVALVHHIRLGACIVRELYLLHQSHEEGSSMSDEDGHDEGEGNRRLGKAVSREGEVSTQVRGCVLSLLSLFEDVMTRGLFSCQVVSGLLFAWRWLLAVPALSTAPALRSENSRRTRNSGNRTGGGSNVWCIPLATLVVQNALSCFRLSASLNAGMFSCLPKACSAVPEPTSESSSSSSSSMSSFSSGALSGNIIGPRYPSRIALLASGSGKVRGSDAVEMEVEAEVEEGDRGGVHKIEDFHDASVHVTWVTFLMEVLLSHNPNGVTSTATATATPPSSRANSHTDTSHFQSTQRGRGQGRHGGSTMRDMPDVSALLWRCLQGVLGHPALLSPSGASLLPR